MKLFVVTRRGSYATETLIIRAKSEADIPPLGVDDYPWYKQHVEELIVEGEPGGIYQNRYIE